MIGIQQLAKGVIMLALTGTPAMAQADSPSPIPDGQSQAEPRPARSPAADKALAGDIVVTASMLDLLGTAQTSSQGSITRQEVERRPVYRTGQLLETVPGLTVTVHSGEGKANQYLLRGFNLDHGTDFATFVDGMPVNQRTHAHGQGYTDLNFLLPELVGGIDFTKGTYFAAAGDFSAVGSARLGIVDTLRPTVSLGAGTVGDRRLFAGGSINVGGGTLLGAGEIFRLDGPWDHPDSFRRYNGVLRWSTGNATDGISLTAMGYSGRWNATTDQPRRAVDQGLIGRFGTLDPSDGGRSFRYSLSAQGAATLGGWQLRANLYAVRQILTLWSNFTHYLNDPQRGDQHAQGDRRWILGGELAVSRTFTLGRIRHAVRLGIQSRYDAVRVDLGHTERRALLSLDRDDRVDEASIAAFVEDEIHWTPWLRTTIGLRVDRFGVRDFNLLDATIQRERASLFQPKGSLALGPWAKTEFYLAAGRDFHSNDGRAGLIATDDGAFRLARPPLLVHADSIEAGIRSNVIRGMTLAATAFQIDFASELTYDADSGQTVAGRPSRRRGLEFTGQYRPLRWLELHANLAFSRSRYRDGAPALRYIEDAPNFIGSAGLSVSNLGRWSGAMVWRKLGAHPLVDDNRLRSPGYSEINASIGYRLTPRLDLRIDLYNVANSRQNAADYYYTTRLPGEPAQGVDDLQFHPLEPRSLRLTMIATW